MRHPQIGPNWFSCLPTAFAVLLDVPVRDLMNEIHHDGSMMIFPNQPEPLCRRGFHLQEFIVPCLKRGYVILEVEASPCVECDNLRYILPGDPTNRIATFMKEFEGVVIGNKPDGLVHALAWDRTTFYNVDGKIYEEYDIEIEVFLALIRCENLTLPLSFSRL